VLQLWNGAPASKATKKEIEMPRCFLVIPLVLLVACSLEAKCGNSMIVVEGVITGSITDATVLVQVTPDANWEPQPVVSIAPSGKFRATVYFDRTRAEGRKRDDCTREPEGVTIQIRKGNRVVDQTNLKIDHDFVKKNRLDYEARLPVALRSN
jgi:hypothetical protein